MAEESMSCWFFPTMNLGLACKDPLDQQISHEIFAPIGEGVLGRGPYRSGFRELKAAIGVAYGSNRSVCEELDAEGLIEEALYGRHFQVRSGP
jgi:DNA-binding transcriptional regulator YhcF (GntR family)